MAGFRGLDPDDPETLVKVVAKLVLEGYKAVSPIHEEKRSRGGRGEPSQPRVN